MIVSFEAKKVVGQVPVTPELKQYYENLFAVLANRIVGKDIVDNIEAIVIPEDFISAVLAFQEEHNDGKPSVTDNEFGRAYGKMLRDPKTGKYTVFIDVMLAGHIMEDNLFNSCFKNLDEDNLSIAKRSRQESLNILAHELSHVELATTLERPKTEKSLHSGYIQQAYNLFDEYYACRKAGALFPSSIADDDEKFILDLEDRIDSERWNYKTHKMSLNQFCSIFHQLSEMTLIRLVSVLGGYAAEGRNDLPFQNSLVGKQAAEFRTCFDRLFLQVVNGDTVDFSELPTSAIDRYFRDLGVEISDTSRGLYYSIPD